MQTADIFEYYVPSLFSPSIKEEFKFILNIKDKITDNITINDVYKFIQDKKLLIISPFSPLIKQQIINGNCKKINNNFPNIKEIYIYQNTYTFLNNGPHNNIFETAQFWLNDILEKKYDFDSVLISCGAYSNILADAFYNMGKNICICGGYLQPYFGISNNRIKNSQDAEYWQKFLGDNYIKEETKQYWITEIPDNYKPDNYKLIEDGCYW
jgi:hypothetical protein